MGLEAFWLAQSDIARLLAQTGWVARIVLLILLGFSILSWAIIFRKYSSFRRARTANEKFLDAFRRTEKFSEIQLVTASLAASPLVPVYVAGMKELQSQGETNPQAGKLKSTDAIGMALHLASAAEVSKLERRMSFLATTGSVTPFIGLLGTVWGIMDAFMGLGEAGATTLRAVAPGIAEALIATAAGLFAAIPAVIAYNHFLHQIREFATRMDNFALEFLSRAEKLYS
ncbi:MAG: protein TolQ [Terriglobia bacterium]